MAAIYRQDMEKATNSGRDAPARWAATLVRAARVGSLGTLEKGTGVPYTSLVTMATDPAGTPVILISRLAVHTQNLMADARCSIMCDAQSMAGGGRGVDDPLALGRVTLIGRAERIAAEPVRGRFLARHPGAEIYADFPDFAFYAIRVERAHFICGFGRIVDLPGAALVLAPDQAGALAGSEPEIISHMNSDHSEVIQLFAAALLGEPASDWRMSGIDPAGLDLVSEAGTARLWFEAPLTTPGAVRTELARLAADARKRAAG
jgi:putative heme iron utilization protein